MRGLLLSFLLKASAWLALALGVAATLIGLWFVFGADWPAVGILLGAAGYLQLALWCYDLDRRIDAIESDVWRTRRTVLELRADAVDEAEAARQAGH